MVEINFQNQEDADYLYGILQSTDASYLQIERKPYQLVIGFDASLEIPSKKKLQLALKKLILDKKRPEWWRKIIEEEFFYTDRDEQDQIISMIHSILAGERKDLSVNTENWQNESLVDQAISDVLMSASSLSIEAFITFRLRFYTEKFPSLIEIAIDEYKLEQDYQMFVYYLRKFIEGRASQVESLFIVNNDGFIFFDEKKQEMKRSVLNKWIDRKLLSHHPIYVDSTTIAPLISINPEKIYLYTDVPDQGIILTLKQVFEERLSIYPLRDFH